MRDFVEKTKAIENVNGKVNLLVFVFTTIISIIYCTLKITNFV